VERRVAPRVRRFASVERATTALAAHIARAARAAVRARGRFGWVVAGGHTPERLYDRLATDYRRVLPWPNVEIYFGDERCVGPRRPESNYRMVRTRLLKRVAVPRSHVARMRGEVRPIARAARDYATRVGGWADRPRFDLVLLGLGPDGHTASLFPRSAALGAPGPVVPVPRSGQPPFVPRLSLGVGALASARELIFLVAGADKSAAVAGTLRAPARGDPRWPASLVHPLGTTTWYLDRAAAADVP
jgi:6-phosphogluconolactonase